MLSRALQNVLNIKQDHLEVEKTFASTTSRLCLLDCNCSAEQVSRSRAINPISRSRRSSTPSSTSSAQPQSSPTSPTQRAHTTRRFAADEDRRVERERHPDAVSKVRRRMAKCPSASMVDRRRTGSLLAQEDLITSECSHGRSIVAHRVYDDSNANKNAAFRWT